MIFRNKLVNAEQTAKREQQSEVGGGLGQGAMDLG